MIDALDESSKREEVLQWLRGVADCRELRHVRLFCTSRPEAEFVDMIPRFIERRNCLKIDEKAVDTDISAFVNAEFQQREELSRKNLSLEIIERIQVEVDVKAKGM